MDMLREELVIKNEKTVLYEFMKNSKGDEKEERIVDEIRSVENSLGEETHSELKVDDKNDGDDFFSELMNSNQNVPLVENRRLKVQYSNDKNGGETTNSQEEFGQFERQDTQAKDTLA